MKGKRVLTLLLAVLLTAAGRLAAPLRADAEDITDAAEITASSGKDLSALRDGSDGTRVSFSAGEELRISSGQKIAGIYLIWQKVYGAWQLDAAGKTQECGRNGFLHEYVPVSEPAEQLTIRLPDKETELCELSVFTEGDLPARVQVWEAPCDRADLMLLSTHSDDEQLFFLGVLPTYAGERKLKVQVVYLTNHWDTESRPHEQLNGLWTVGVKNYPIIGAFPDDPETLGGKDEELDTIRDRALDIFGRDALLSFQKEMLERFRPQVVIAHDVDGEYRHGAHMANTWSLQQALEQASWSVPKVYLHLWPENTLQMDWDQPLSAFGGKTAYEVSKEGYACHESQQWTWFTRWIQGDGISKASDIEKYSPCRYGLYRTTVGQDEAKNDFMEHLTPYTDPTPAPTPTVTPEAARPTPTASSPRAEEESGSGKTVLISVLLLLAAGGLLLLFFRKKK